MSYFPQPTVQKYSIYYSVETKKNSNHQSPLALDEKWWMDIKHSCWLNNWLNIAALVIPINAYLPLSAKCLSFIALDTYKVFQLQETSPSPTPGFHPPYGCSPLTTYKSRCWQLEKRNSVNVLLWDDLGLTSQWRGSRPWRVEIY